MLSNELKPICYLGAPYSDPDPKIRQFREQAVTQKVFDLWKKGILVYSPLTHNCPVDRLGVFGDYQTWLDFDHSMLSRCDKLLFLKLPGWEKSKGLQAEMAFAKQLGLPIKAIEVEPEFLEKISTMESPESALSQIVKKINQMCEERDWDSFNSPKNLSMSLQVEASEVAEHFTWITEEQSEHLSPSKKQEVADELADVFINLAHLSDKLGIDLFAVTHQKIEKIKQRYPIKIPVALVED